MTRVNGRRLSAREFVFVGMRTVRREPLGCFLYEYATDPCAEGGPAAWTFVQRPAGWLGGYGPTGYRLFVLDHDKGPGP